MNDDGTYLETRDYCITCGLYLHVVTYHENPEIKLCEDCEDEFNATIRL